MYYVVFVLLCVNYHAVGCHVRVWANNANNDSGRVYLALLTKHVERCQLACDVIPGSEFRGRKNKPLATN